MSEQVIDVAAGPGSASGLSPGEQLRAARERAGWTAERLAAELCLPLARLHALEQDEHERFGGVVFVRGYLRRAALLLGIPPQELIAAFEACCNGVTPAEIQPGPVPGQLPRRGVPGWTGPLAIVAVAAIAVASTWWLMGPSPEGVTTAGTGAAPAPAMLEFTTPTAVEAPPGAPEPAPEAEPEPELRVAETPRPAVDVVAAGEPLPLPPGTVELRFEFTEDCWLEVVDAEDRQLAYRLQQAGDVVRLRGTAPVSVFFGNAEGVHLALDGESVPVRPARRDGTARLTVGGGAG
ncbi:MAG: helix-turn-helix domain-containing protein [Gammaproteobacteria bacterium]